jgi:hypothetical protein
MGASMSSVAVASGTGSVAVAPAWDGVVPVAAVASCLASGDATVADAIITGTFVNTTTQVITVRLTAAGVSDTVGPLNPGESADFTIHTGSAALANSAVWELVTPAGGRDFTTSVAVTHDGLDCVS